MMCIGKQTGVHENGRGRSIREHNNQTRPCGLDKGTAKAERFAAVAGRIRRGPAGIWKACFV